MNIPETFAFILTVNERGNLNNLQKIILFANPVY